MSIVLLRNLFRLVTFVVSLVFVGAILELLGLALYLQWASEAALNDLLAGGVGFTEAVEFILASPDRVLVAGVLAAVSVFIVLADRSGASSNRHAGDDFGDGGGFGGFDGDGDGGGGGGE